MSRCIYFPLCVSLLSVWTHKWGSTETKTMSVCETVQVRECPTLIFSLQMLSESCEPPSLLPSYLPHHPLSFLFHWQWHKSNAAITQYLHSMESFSKNKSFMILKCAEKQNQIQGCKDTHRTGTTNPYTGTHTQQIPRKCLVTKHIRVIVTGHRGSESSASRVIHHPHVHKHWTEMLIFIRSCRLQDWNWIQRSNHMWHNSQVRNLKQKTQCLEKMLFLP